jgi:hypothetical protein
VLQEFPSLPAQPSFDDRGEFFYTQFLKGTTRFCGLELPTYGVKVKVLSEQVDLTGAKILVDLKAISA